jgi:hypothetical protein
MARRRYPQDSLSISRADPAPASPAGILLIASDSTSLVGLIDTVLGGSHCRLLTGLSCLSRVSATRSIPTATVAAAATAQDAKHDSTCDPIFNCFHNRTPPVSVETVRKSERSLLRRNPFRIDAFPYSFLSTSRGPSDFRINLLGKWATCGPRIAGNSPPEWARGAISVGWIKSRREHDRHFGCRIKRNRKTPEG